MPLTYVLCHGSALLVLDWLLFHLLQFANRLWVIPEVFLVADEDDRHIGTEVAHLNRVISRLSLSY